MIGPRLEEVERELDSLREVAVRIGPDITMAVVVPEHVAQPYLERRRLKRVLEDWCPPYTGYHLYYPSRRQPSTALALMVDALRYRV